MTKQLEVVIVSLMAVVAACSAQDSRHPSTNSPTFKVSTVLDLKKDGAFVFTFCPASRDLFVSFDEESSQIVHRWNVDTGRKTASYKLPKKFRCDVAVVSPDGNFLVIVGYDMLHDALHKADIIRLVDLNNDKTIKDLIYDGTPARVQFSRAGKFFVTRQYTHEPGGELVYDLAGKEQRSFDLKAFDNPEASQVVWLISNRKGGPRPGLFHHDAQGNEQRLYPSPDKHWSDVSSYVVSTNKQFAACSTRSGRLMIWHLPDAKLIFDSQIGKSAVQIAYDSKTDHILFADGDVDKKTSLQAVALSTSK